MSIVLPRSKVIVLALAVSMIVSIRAFGQGNSISNLSLEQLDGSSAKLSKFLEKGPVYITFWALWCEQCKLELRALKGFAKEHENDSLAIIAVNQDSPKSIAKVKAYVKSQGYPFSVALDPNSQLFQAFNGQNLPFSVLLDKSGKVVSTRTGYYPGDEKAIESEILKLVSKN